MFHNFLCWFFEDLCFVDLCSPSLKSLSLLLLICFFSSLSSFLVCFGLLVLCSSLVLSTSNFGFLFFFRASLHFFQFVFLLTAVIIFDSSLLFAIILFVFFFTRLCGGVSKSLSESESSASVSSPDDETSSSTSSAFFFLCLDFL